MEKGYQPDGIDDGRWKAGEWVEGKPQPSFWTGLKIGEHDRHKIEVFRCQSCGCLESYAK